MLIQQQMQHLLFEGSHVSEVKNETSTILMFKIVTTIIDTSQEAILAISTFLILLLSFYS